jgi:cytoskeletal protein CcmA (bactofilin family)
MKKLNKTTAIGSGTASILIGGGIIIENASLRGSGVLRIDGEFHGSIDMDGHIILGKTGVISGDIHAESALFAGKYHGNLQIRNTLHITSTAVLNGHIDTGKLIIDEGGIFNGICNITDVTVKNPLNISGVPDVAVFDEHLFKDAEA